MFRRWFGHRIWCVFALCGALLVLMACAPKATPAPAPPATPTPAPKQFTLKAQFFLPKASPLSQRLLSIYREIEAASGGRLKIRDFWAGELVPTPQALDALSRGTLDILVGPGNYYSGKVAIGDISIMPLNFKAASDRSKAFYDTELGQILDKVYSQTVGATVVGPFNYFIGEEVLLRKGVEVSTAADFKGLKLRVAGGELVELVKALGAEPVFIPPPEVYTALQRGTIDGAIFPIHDLEILKLKEVVGQVVGPSFLFSGPMMHFFKVNLDTWNGLPPDLRQAFRQVVKKAALEDDARAIEELETPYRERAKAEGVRFYTLPQPEIEKVMAAVEQAREYYLKRNREQGFGPEAEKVMQILQKLAGL